MGQLRGWFGACKATVEPCVYSAKAWWHVSDGGSILGLGAWKLEKHFINFNLLI